jgi:hypothetical protein
VTPALGCGCHWHHFPAGFGTAPADIRALLEDRLYVALMSARHALALGRTRLTHLGTDATGVEMKRRMPAHELRVEHAYIRVVLHR